MKSIRVLHVDNDPIARSTVQHSIELDASFVLKSCASAEGVDRIAADFIPDLMLCDAMESVAGGQHLLIQLINIAAAAGIPIVAVTTNFALINLDRLKALGINGTISKPFDPFALPELLRSDLRSFRFKAVGYDFEKRLLADAVALKALGLRFSDEPDSETISEGLQICAHKLAGAAGVFNFLAVSEKASALEESVIARRTGRGSEKHIKLNLDALLQCIERA